MDEQLKCFWKQQGGQDRLADQFVSEMNYFLTRTPAINSNDGRKQTTKEREKYTSVVKHCDKLLKALEEIPNLDRLNILSLREQRPEFNNKKMPICDPLDYVATIKETAEYYSEQLKQKGVSKFSRQLYELYLFLGRYPLAKNINRSHFIELATILWKPYAGEVNASKHGKNIETAVDKIGYKNLSTLKTDEK